MPDKRHKPPPADVDARIQALTRHDRTLLVEAGAGSGKTALMAGRAALLVAGGVAPRNIAAITFTEAAAAELLERIERIVRDLLSGKALPELEPALPEGLSESQRANLKEGADTLDELTCTTIHGFCQKLIAPYPVESGRDPGATILDPGAADLVFEDLVNAWLSARFGRDPRRDGLGRTPPVTPASPDGEDLFAAMMLKSPDETLKLIGETAHFLKEHRTAGAAVSNVDREAHGRFVSAVRDFARWYREAGIEEPDTAAIVDDLLDVAEALGESRAGTVSGERLTRLLDHRRPAACKKNETKFRRWRALGKWKTAAKTAGLSASLGGQRFESGLGLYDACGEAYVAFCNSLGSIAFERFVAEFDEIRKLYRDFKRDAALLDFDDLLYQARDLLRDHEPVRAALAARYSHVLVDEFQDTDPLQAEIIWRLGREGPPREPWQDGPIRPGALFLVGDPKQAIYRFRGADVQTYLAARRALSKRDPASILRITANFRSRAPVLDYVNGHFEDLLKSEAGQPGFTPLSATREAGDDAAVAAFDIETGEDQSTGNRRVSAHRVRQVEAGVVADAVERLIGAFPVFDNEAGGSRTARPKHIALLAPTGTSLWIYERALEERGIPIATQAGKGFFRRQEVQDLIAVARAISDARDTLAFGALIRGPLVGLSDEQIADEIHTLPVESERAVHLDVRTDPSTVRSPVLRDTLEVLQRLREKRHRATPYQILAEAIESLHVRPILRARHRGGAERALANVELTLEMSRHYAGRGIEDFARALWQRWEDEEAQVEGRPDAATDAVSIITMHSAKGLEWPIVIPINSATGRQHYEKFLYRRRDDSVHFKIFGYAGSEHAEARLEELEEQDRERVRLWYVALTRARDLLLLPRQRERSRSDWWSLIDIDVESLPAFDTGRYTGSDVTPDDARPNLQDRATWKRERRSIADGRRTISWRRPSRHEDTGAREDEPAAVSSGNESVDETTDEWHGWSTGRERLKRGLILHKLMEEVLTGETPEGERSLQARAAELIEQQGLDDAADASSDISSVRMAALVVRTLNRPEIASLRPRLLPECWVYGSKENGRKTSITAGIADAVALDGEGRIDVVVDWKSDTVVRENQVSMYRGQVREYLKATGAKTGLIVFLNSDRIVTVGEETERSILTMEPDCADRAGNDR